MSNSEELLRKAHALYTTRRVMLLLNAAAYVAWMLGLAMNTGTAEGARNPVWGLLQTVGPVLWGISIAGVLWTVSQTWRRRDLTVLIDDERTRTQTARAFQIGYFVLLFPPAIIYTASYYTHIDVRLVMPLLMAAGVATPSLAYALFFRS